jgi:hypothetical protein
MAAGRSAVLVAVTSGSAKVGLVLFEMRKAATRIAEVMGETVAVEHASAAEPTEPSEPTEPASPVEYPSENGAAPVADAGEMPPLPEQEGLEEEEYVEEAPASPQFGAPSTPPPAHESAFSTWH